MVNRVGGENPKIGGSHEEAVLASLLIDLAVFGEDDGVLRVEDGARGAECRYSKDGTHWERYQCKSDSSATKWTARRFVLELLAGAEEALVAGEPFIVHSLQTGVIPQVSLMAQQWDQATWVQRLTDSQRDDVQRVADARLDSTAIEDTYPLLRNVAWRQADEAAVVPLLNMTLALVSRHPAHLVMAGLKDLAGSIGEHRREAVVEILGGDPRAHRAALLNALPGSPARLPVPAWAWEVIDDAMRDIRWPSPEERGTALAAVVGGLASQSDFPLSHPGQEPDICTVWAGSGRLHLWLEFPARGANAGKGVLVRATPKPWHETRWAFADDDELSAAVGAAVLTGG
jgi:hypothetical protein